MQRKSKLDTTGLYVENVKATLWGGYMHPNAAPYPTTPILWLAHTVLLPVSLTLGSGIKTFLDVKTRHELTDSDIENLKTHLLQLDNNQFNQVVNQIIKYNPKSKFSQILKTDLEKANINAEEKFEKAKQEVCANIRNHVINKAIEQLDPNIATYVTITAKSELEAKFTDDELARIEEISQKLKESITGEKRKIQEDAILAYIDNNINAGTKMQNIINESVETSFKMRK